MFDVAFSVMSSKSNQHVELPGGFSKCLVGCYYLMFTLLTASHFLSTCELFTLQGGVYFSHDYEQWLETDGRRREREKEWYKKNVEQRFDLVGKWTDSVRKLFSVKTETDYRLCCYHVWMLSMFVWFPVCPVHLYMYISYAEYDKVDNLSWITSWGFLSFLTGYLKLLPADIQVTSTWIVCSTVINVIYWMLFTLADLAARLTKTTWDTSVAH